MTSSVRLVAACLVVSLVLGSVHAYSVLLLPLQGALDSGRAAVSLGYAFALVSITLMVFWGPRIYPTRPPSVLFAVACLSAALGVAVLAAVPSRPALWLGYGVIFGAGNGLGYGYGLQLAARCLPGREGMGMGLVTAAYGLGAALAAWPLQSLTASFGLQSALWLLCLSLVVVGVVSALLSLGAGTGFFQPRRALPDAARPVMLWFAYFGVVLAGLMAIGHAAGIAQTNGAADHAWLAPAIVAIANTSAAAVGGVLSDRFRPRPILVAMAGLGALALAVLAISPGFWIALVCLGSVGAAYGATIAIYPTMIAKAYGPDGPSIYGKVFTAWGVAGLSGPWIAGALFDSTGGYGLALSLACAAALMAAFINMRSQPN